jgi:hypothetical protein
VDNSVRSVVMVKRTGEQTEVTSIYTKAKKKRKRSRGFKMADKTQKRMLEAQQKFASELLRRNEKSARKKRDGGLRDFGWNFLRAQQRAMDVLLDTD